MVSSTSAGRGVVAEKDLRHLSAWLLVRVTERASARGNIARCQVVPEVKNMEL